MDGVGKGSRDGGGGSGAKAAMEAKASFEEGQHGLYRPRRDLRVSQFGEPVQQFEAPGDQEVAQVGQPSFLGAPRLVEPGGRERL